jgi:hypothetical protein
LDQEKRVDFLIFIVIMASVMWLFAATRRLHRKIAPPEVKVGRTFIIIKGSDITGETAVAAAPESVTDPAAVPATV